ncbi:MAG: LPS export ABC transporter periplasmic protein LptC [Elusimicrobia bacterium]|nr:LPS export ABC transporter periplasmic protein LptC [Elusimicrobiota bacterium]
MAAATTLTLPLLPLLAAALLAGCRPPKAEAPESYQSLEDFTMSRSRFGKESWVLKARLALLYEDSKSAMLTAPDMEVMEAGRKILRARASRGTADIETHDVVLVGAAKLDFLQEDSVLETEELKFSSKARQFHTDREVVLRRPGAVIHGKGCVAGSDLSEVRVFNQRSVFQPAEAAHGAKTPQGSKAKK